MSRKVISIITPHYSPEITAAAHRIEVAAHTLSSAFSVHVFTLMERGTRSANRDLKHSANLTVHYIPQPYFSKSLFFLRALFEIWYSFRLVLKARTVDADLTIVTAPYIFLLPITAWLCKTKKVADVRDLVWHYLPARNFLTRFIRNRLRRVMHHALHKFDAVTLTNEAEKRWMIQNGFSESLLNVIPNGLSAGKYKQLIEVKYTPHPQKLTITYIGNIGSSQHFNCLIDAVCEMKDVRLNIVGEGNEFRKLAAYIHAKKISNVTLTGKLKWRRIVPYYQTSNILYASLRQNFDTAIPSKLYEYLATGLPVIYHGGGAGADLVRNYENAYVLNSLDPSELQKVIWKISKSNPGKSHKNIQDIGKNFIREKLSRRYVELSAFLLNEKTLSHVYVEDVLETIQ